MTYSLSVKQKGGFFKTTPDFATLQKQFGATFYIGGIGQYFNFVDKPAPPSDGMEAEYMLYGRTAPLGRGFYLYIEKGFASFEVTTALPTTKTDLEDMFAFAGALSKYLGEKDICDDTGCFKRSHLPVIYPTVLNNNYELLKSYAISRPGFSVSGVRFPLHLSTLLCGRIGGVPPENGEKFFSSFLNENQALNLEYLTPSFYRDDASDEARGRYDIREETGYLIPKKPFIPYGPNPFGNEPVEGWQVSLMSDKLGVLGTLPYGVFVERLETHEKRDFDEKHYILHALSMRRMQDIIQGS